MKTGDQAALFAFDTQLEKVTDFTADFKGLESKVDKVDPPFGQTSLYDAIAETAKAVAESVGSNGRISQRSGIVVLTDGIDTKSRLTAPEVSAIASSIDVPVYIVAVMSPVDDPRNPDYGTGAIVNFAKVSPMPKAGGKWNTYEITAKGTQLTVVMNGVQTVNVQNSQFTQGPFALQFGNRDKGAPGGPIKWRIVQIKPL